ncbi:hypothetical protein A3D68_01220 [Candidatus Adlerbacteria bacterium RIFCSPHIGHO2_02_FULL_52_17]|uniref:Glycoside hydrolase family 5 domain-containing protein n=1 Tax=Candidatus Adlerbacteria bacterium RIFCSPHIGHO2_02_FULL_52_17 TaxID=1797240 RepID=A0A1F4XS94_9BACT|nr:MAG: hypothetical protein A3D68_01220 [Candidatus Adlerbacteria bacterium RIFCSPHIGHO2_02_FULL_52_17]
MTAEVTRPGGAKVTAQSAVIVTPLKYLFCDIKRPVALREWNLSQSNYQQVIDAFKSELGCNGIRLGIDSKTLPGDTSKIAPDSTPEGYTKLYRDVFAYARQKNLLIYANMLPEGKSDVYTVASQSSMIDRVSAYTNYFCPDFLGPFNEDGHFTSHSSVVIGIKSRLTSSCTDPNGNSVSKAKIVGPDPSSRTQAINYLTSDPTLLGTLDIYSTHNNTGGVNTTGGGNNPYDTSVTVTEWQDFDSQVGSKPVWASEMAGLTSSPTGGWDMVPFTGNHTGKQVGVKAVIDSGVISGLVLYMAPRFIDDTDGDGIYTLKSMAGILAQGLCAAGWDRSCPKVLGASTTREASLIEIIWSYITGTIGAAAAALFNFPF